MGIGLPEMSTRFGTILYREYLSYVSAACTEVVYQARVKC